MLVLATLALPLSVPGLWLLWFYVRQGLGLPSPTRTGWRLSVAYNGLGALLVAASLLSALSEPPGWVGLGLFRYLGGVAFLSWRALAAE